MPQINCEINIILTWSKDCVISALIGAAKFAILKISNTKLFIPVVTLSMQDNTKLLQQLNSGFKQTINCKKY